MCNRGFFEKSFEVCKNNKEVGWSFGNSNVPIFVGFLMKHFSRNKKNVKKIDDFWRHYTDGLPESGEYGKLIADSLNNLVLSEAEEERLYEWCERICGKRVDSIVSEKHRSAYGRAVMALVALAEAKSCLYGEQEGQALIDKFSRKYPRHNKFRALIKELGKSVK